MEFDSGDFGGRRYGNVMVARTPRLAVFHFEACRIAVQLLQARACICQADSADPCGSAAPSPARCPSLGSPASVPVRDAEIRIVPAAAHPADAVTHGIFDDRLQAHVRYGGVERTVVGRDLDTQPVLKPNLLDGKVQPQILQLPAQWHLLRFDVLQTQRSRSLRRPSISSACRPRCWRTSTMMAFIVLNRK